MRIREFQRAKNRLGVPTPHPRQTPLALWAPFSPGVAGVWQILRSMRVVLVHGSAWECVGVLLSRLPWLPRFPFTRACTLSGREFKHIPSQLRLHANSTSVSCDFIQAGRILALCAWSSGNTHTFTIVDFSREFSREKEPELQVPGDAPNKRCFSKATKAARIL